MNHTHALHAALALTSMLLLHPAPAQAGVHVDVHLGLPVAPPLVVVQPGVQVVENFDEEVYFTSGHYWVRREGAWYRARRPRAAFVMVPPRAVPVALIRMPPGQYVRYSKPRHRHDDDRDHDRDDRHGNGHGHGHGKGHGKHKHKH